MNRNSVLGRVGASCRVGNVLASAKFLRGTYFFHTAVLVMPSRPIRFPSMLLLWNCCAGLAATRELRRPVQRSITWRPPDPSSVPASRGPHPLWIVFQDTRI